MFLSGCSANPGHDHHGQLFSTLLDTSKPLSLSQLLTSDPLFHQQWYLKNTGQISRAGVRGTVNSDIRLTQSHLIPDHEKKVILAVIDSGIDLSHPDINLEDLYFNPGENGLDKLGLEKSKNGIDDDENGYVDDSLGWSFSSNKRDVSDSLGHGTHVAGLLISQSNNGIGVGTLWKGFKLMPVQIFDAEHPTADHVTIASAIRYAVDNGAHVISASFGSSTPSEQMRAAVEYAEKNDVVLVSAVGNFRKNNDEEPTYPAHFGFNNQIAVGASDHRDIASNFSNFGKNSVDIFAPGEDILSIGLNESYAIRSGTSQACPLISGAVAVAKYLNFDESAEQIIQRVLNAADEQKGLQVFSRDGLRVNIDNIILSREGARLKNKDSMQWRFAAFELESEHPYRSNLSVTYPIIAPAAATHFRIHFQHFATQSSDTLEILDSHHSIITSLSGNLGSFWSPVINGNSAYIRFVTD
ncbi:MAG: hypothetical protein RJB13_1774, partial [Pseudomonadota bacterium]